MASPRTLGTHSPNGPATPRTRRRSPAARPSSSRTGAPSPTPPSPSHTAGTDPQHQRGPTPPRRNPEAKRSGFSGAATGPVTPTHMVRDLATHFIWPNFFPQQSCCQCLSVPPPVVVTRMPFSQTPQCRIKIMEQRAMPPNIFLRSVGPIQGSLFGLYFCLLSNHFFDEFSKLCAISAVQVKMKAEKKNNKKTSSTDDSVSVSVRSNISIPCQTHYLKPQWNASPHPSKECRKQNLQRQIRFPNFFPVFFSFRLSNASSSKVKTLRPSIDLRVKYRSNRHNHAIVRNKTAFSGSLFTELTNTCVFASM